MRTEKYEKNITKRGLTDAKVADKTKVDKVSKEDKEEKKPINYVTLFIGFMMVVGWLWGMYEAMKRKL